MTTHYLHNLTTKELLAILKHVQFGHDYLQRHLKREDYATLLSLGSLSNNQTERIESDRQEKLGNVAVVVNTILTSCFGAWLGFNGFNHSSIISFFGLVIIFAAVTIGLLVGYLSYILTHRQAKLASKHLQLCNVQRVIIDIIIHKRQNKIEGLRNKIFSMVNSIDPSVNLNQNEEKRLFDVIKHLRLRHVSHPLFPLIKKSLKQIKISINKLMRADNSANKTDSESFDSGDLMINTSLTNASYIKILTKSDLPNKHQLPKIDRWLRSNLASISVGLLPTLLGSFASMFVFLNGFPAFCDQYGISFGFTPFEIFLLKDVMLGLACSVSIYFAYSHIHSNYKTFKRMKQLEISENQISEKTNYMLQLISRLHQWSKIAFQLQYICDLKEHVSEEVFVQQNPLEDKQSLAG